MATVKHKTVTLLQLICTKLCSNSCWHWKKNTQKKKSKKKQTNTNIHNIHLNHSCTIFTTLHTASLHPCLSPQNTQREKERAWDQGYSCHHIRSVTLHFNAKIHWQTHLITHTGGVPCNTPICFMSMQSLYLMVWTTIEGEAGVLTLDLQLGSSRYTSRWSTEGRSGR